MARWIIVRHGETDWNKSGKLQGQTNTMLSAGGRVQVAALRERLRGVKLDAVYTSDLARCIETATLVIQGRTLSPEPTTLLRELAYGEWEGLTWAEVQERDPESYDQWLRLDPNFEPPGGETIAALMERAEGFAARVRDTGAEGTTLIVAHGGSIRALVLHLLGHNESHFRSFGNPAPASITVMGLYEGTAVLETWNDASHYRPLT